MKKFLSKKLFVSILVMATSVILLCFGKLTENVFAFVFSGAAISYLFVEGTLDLSSIKKFKAGNIEAEVSEEANDA